MTEYAAAYGGFPAPDAPWPLVLHGIRRALRFSARQKLHFFDAVRDGIAAAFSEGRSSELMRDELFRASYPTGRTGPALALTQNGKRRDA